MESQTFIFFGIVGSGKGTQVKLLMDFLTKKDGKSCIYAYPGNEYRELMASGTQTAQLVQASMHKGELQPDFLTNAIFVNSLKNLGPEKHMIADGYPRTVVQSETFIDIANFYGRKNIKIIYITLSKEEAIKRMQLRARHDDTEEGIKKRFEEYEKNIIPAMNYFRDKEDYEILTINGEQTIAEVHRDILKVLKLEN